MLDDAVEDLCLRGLREEADVELCARVPDQLSGQRSGSGLVLILEGKAPRGAEAVLAGIAVSVLGRQLRVPLPIGSENIAAIIACSSTL